MSERERESYARILAAEMEAKEREMRELEEMTREAGFSPRLSLQRTPPGGFSPMPVDLQEEVSAPGTSAGKRPLTSPQEVQEVLRRRIAARKPAVPPVGGILNAPEAPTPAPLKPNDPADPKEAVKQLSSSSIEELAGLATVATMGVMDAIHSKYSKLNKEELALIGQHITAVGSVVTTLISRLATAEQRAAVAEAKLEAASTAATVVPSTAVGQPQETYADRLKRRSAGPVVAVYPKEGTDLKSSEETRALIKTSVAPAKLGIQVNRVRRVGNAGVVVQTNTAGDLEKLKAALPSTLRTSDVKGKSPLVIIRDLEGKDPDWGELLKALHDQNFREDPTWTLEAMQAQSRLAFRKSRLNSSYSAVVIACSPQLRKALVDKGRLYIGWEVSRVEDFTTAVICGKCSMYGHNERRCRQDTVTCSRCGGSGHAAGECKEEQAPVKCATCSKFGQKGAEGHATGARDCPARVSAERRMLEVTNY